MLSIYEAMKIILDSTNPISQTEIIPIEMATNRVLSQNIKATFDMPRFNNSAMDGYGVKLCDASKYVEIIQKTLAGDKSSKITPSKTIKIMTGAKVDDSIEAVVPIEFVKIENNKVLLPSNIKPFANIRLQAEEFKKGDILLEKGKLISKKEIALIASLGISHIEVYQKPKILVIPTGNEIKNHYDNINEFQHFNSSSIYFYLEELADVSISKIASDNIKDIENSISSKYDLIITSGGISKGDADFTKKAFENNGFDIKFAWIDIKPGKPFVFATKDNLATLLTGNPLAGVYNYNIFVKPLIRKLAGLKDFYIDFLYLSTQNSITRKAGRDEVIPAKLTNKGIYLSTKRGSGMISVFNENDGVIIIDKNIWKIEENKTIKYIDFTKWSDEFKEFITK